MNLADNLTRTADLHGDRTVIKLDDFELSYAALDIASQMAAGWLSELGVEPGDRVCLMLPNLPQFPILYYGILRAGAVVVPMNPLLKSREIEFFLTDSGAKVIFAWEGVAEEAVAGALAANTNCILVSTTDFAAELGQHTPQPGVVDRAAEDTAVILYTSGTTGKPKGAELTHSNLLSNIEASVGLFGGGPDDVIFGGLPLFHSFGQTCGLNSAVALGASLTLLPRFEPKKALEVLQRDKVTVLQAVPTMYVALLQEPEHGTYDTSALRLCVSGGASLPVEVLKGFESEFGSAILEGYGLSETSPVASFNHPDRERKPGSIGTPIAGVEMRLVDGDWNDVGEGEIGEIAIKGPNVMKGYWNRPEATSEVVRGEWFRTGDLATRDDEGYYFIVDRAKDMIIRGGFNVYPREIEEVLYEHPAVAEAAVIGIPDAVMGEEIGAAITLKPGSTASTDEIRAFVKDRVAPYKYPRVVWLAPEGLPKGPTGKILKREITPG
ncbi:MAG TPA: long-chain fatty acid--CoA ligase [Actinomycetota bacterium]|nr:long-chain fatty acid--CoA ligase [Actinomycetota bacterium]